MKKKPQTREDRKLKYTMRAFEVPNGDLKKIEVLMDEQDITFSRYMRRLVKDDLKKSKT